MVESRGALVGIATVLAVTSAVAVSDYRYQPFSFVFKPLIAPLLFSVPLAVGTLRVPPILRFSEATIICALLLLVHEAVSTYIYWLSAGDALFDGLSIPITKATLIVQTGVAVLVFVTAWLVRRRRERRHHG